MNDHDPVESVDDDEAVADAEAVGVEDTEELDAEAFEDEEDEELEASDPSPEPSDPVMNFGTDDHQERLLRERLARNAAEAAASDPSAPFDRDKHAAQSSVPHVNVEQGERAPDHRHNGEAVESGGVVHNPASMTAENDKYFGIS